MTWQMNHDRWYNSVRPCVTHIDVLVELIHGYYGRYYMESNDTWDNDATVTIAEAKAIWKEDHTVSDDD
jgi:hypothetical protein